MKKQWVCLILAIVLLAGVCPAARSAYTEMHFSDGVVEYVKLGEGFSERAFHDGTGWYIGYGCSVNPADYPNGITEEGADALLRSYMQQFADYINERFLKKYDIRVTQGQFDAMIGMSYALGTSWMNAGNRLPTYLKTGIEKYTDQQIASAFAAWCHVGGAVNTVALKRRIMEANMFLYDDYDFSHYGADLGWNWIILDANGGENELSDVAVYKTGEPYGTLPNASRSGWYFAGWEKEDGVLLLATDQVAGNLNLKARWSATPPQPAEPEEPVEPEEPTEPTEPEEPAEPEEPTEPEEPEEPAEPPQPSVPEEPVETGFPDVLPGDWFARYVVQLASSGVVNGYLDGTFRPDNNVTWGEALKLILLSSGFSAQDPPEAEKEEAAPHWAAGYLAFAEKAGYLKKGSVGDLDSPISRNELADLCAAALELTVQAQPNPYADSTRASALKLYAAGIMEGSDDERGVRVFKGGDRLRRSEICAVLVRVQDYVARTWILYAGKRIPINYDLKFNPYDPDAFTLRNGRTVYLDSTLPVRYGIDVSRYQGEIDWAKVAADGIGFAFIRCGYRSYTKGTLNEDEYFVRNIRGALENGIEVGVYFFSQALNVSEAMEELDYVLALITGWDVTLPVVFDWEQMLNAGSRTKSPNWPAVTDCIIAFCDGVTAAGYTPMAYFNPSLAYLHLDLARLERFPKWLAHYVDVTNYQYDYQMWQYGCSGYVSGISGRVDMDILFTDFT